MKNMKETGLSKYSISKDGKIWSSYVNRFLKPSPNIGGYLTHHLATDDGGLKTFYVHKLVAKTYLENTNTLATQVNHIDGNKYNNSITYWIVYAIDNRHKQFELNCVKIKDNL